MTKAELLARLRKPGKVLGAVRYTEHDMVYVQLVKSDLIDIIQKSSDDIEYKVTVRGSTTWID